MTPAVSPVPAGYTSLTPFFVCDGAERAIAFYEAVLGAQVVNRNDTPDGTKVAHCELQLATGRLQLSDPMPDHHLVAASGGDDVSRSTVAYLPDVDAAYERAVALGAKGYGAPETFVTGDRYAAFLDPWGHRWAIMTRVEDVDPEEAARRVDAWLAENAETPDA
ncbi:VOC family protein [Frankia nepalensis]|uniref:VOC family protein n=1 Tax=Frankia nepalensis TaxID=1836974 RepID=UPI0038993D26